jgi:hypothetical protein
MANISIGGHKAPPGRAPTEDSAKTAFHAQRHDVQKTGFAFSADRIFERA